PLRPAFPEHRLRALRGVPRETQQGKEHQFLRQQKRFQLRPEDRNRQVAASQTQNSISDPSSRLFPCREGGCRRWLPLTRATIWATHPKPVFSRPGFEI